MVGTSFLFENIENCYPWSKDSQQKHVLCLLILRDNIMLYYRKGGMVS